MYEVASKSFADWRWYRLSPRLESAMRVLGTMNARYAVGDLVVSLSSSSSSSSSSLSSLLCLYLYIL